MKTQSVFFPPELIRRIRGNLERPEYAGQRDLLRGEAEYWRNKSDEELWEFVFGPAPSRSWMVWSDGFCPSCQKDVPMYSWIIDPFNHPWKTECPHCGDRFPKNDFYRFYESGLNDQKVFDPDKADRSLLVNTDHPDPRDPLHTFGVDDGEGYTAGGNRWRFIGCYLIYGQWKKLILGGIQKLADAYLVTGDPVYARKAGIMLDRLADLHPSYDFQTQGILYEGKHTGQGYLSYWIDAASEIRELVFSYDKIFDSVKNDEAFLAFLGRKAAECKTVYPKRSFRDVQTNIEERILRDVLEHPIKIRSNAPFTEYTLAVIQTVLGWPENRDEILERIGAIVEGITKVDGLQGEKGLAHYSTMSTKGMSSLLATFGGLDLSFLASVFERYPQLRQTFRFHMDMWCLDQTYYPSTGDGGNFALPIRKYPGVDFAEHNRLGPSMYTFFWNLYQVTGDAAFVQLLYKVNGSTVRGLPYDIMGEDPEQFRQNVKAVIEREGPVIKLGSVNKQLYGLAILRSGSGKDSRALWIDYAHKGGHAHSSAMSIGLLAKGLDLLPDFGYPPVMFGGWESARAMWYRMPAAHNTVSVDGQFQERGIGQTALWAIGDQVKAIRVTGADLIKGKQFERTVALLDISESDFYVFDVFRVVGGHDHAKFVYGHFGDLSTKGLALLPADGYGHGTMLRNFQGDQHPSFGWSAEWKVRDVHRVLPEGADVSIRCTDLTSEAAAYTAEAWICYGKGFADYTSKIEDWIPCVMVRRTQAQETGELASTFAGIVEAFGDRPALSGMRRLAIAYENGAAAPDSDVAVEVELVGGRQDLLLSLDVEDASGRKTGLGAAAAAVKEWEVAFAGEFCAVRRRAGKLERLTVCNASSVRVGALQLDFRAQTGLLELEFSEDGEARAVKGDPEAIAHSSFFIHKEQ